MNDPEILTAAKTLMSMCLDFQMGGINQNTFVSNLGLFSRFCKDRAAGQRESAPKAPNSQSDAITLHNRIYDDVIKIVGDQPTALLIADKLAISLA
jgi:hypothetical protein